MTLKNRVPHPRPVGEEFFLRYCASTPLEEYSSGMCVVFAERVGEIAISARFDSFYHDLLISQRELSRQDERFAARFHRFARVVRDADIVENQPTNPIRFFRREIRLAKDRSNVGLRRVLVEKRSLVAGTKGR